MRATDDTMTRIGEGIELARKGKREQARVLFEMMWREIGPDGDALRRCALAHSMADVQDDPNDELEWDLTALDAARQASDEDVKQAGMLGSIADFYPSLYLNLADVHNRLGNYVDARTYLALAREHVARLAVGDYRRMLADALDRLSMRMRG